MSDLHTAAPRPAAHRPRTWTNRRTLDGVVRRLPAGRLRRLPAHRTASTVPAQHSPAASSPAPCSVPSRSGRWGRARPRPMAWILATAVGLMAGWPPVLRWSTTRQTSASLVDQGAVTGALVGIAQAVVLVPRLGVLAFAWPFFLSGTFAVGWAVTTSAGIDVDQQFTIFGSSGALVATLLTAVLPLVLSSHRHRAGERVMTRHVVFGTGQVGRPLVDQLVAQGHDVVAVNRTGHGRIPGAHVVGGDASDPSFTSRICAGADVVYFCLNARNYARWDEEFPPLQRGVLAGATPAGARLVVLENLYAYGRPNGRALVETMPANPTSKKAATRAAMTEELHRAHAAGQVQVAIGRASDYFGPGVSQLRARGDRVRDRAHRSAGPGHGRSRPAAQLLLHARRGSRAGAPRHAQPRPPERSGTCRSPRPARPARSSSTSTEQQGIRHACWPRDARRCEPSDS